MAQSSEIGELRKVNRALEELNLEMERNAKGFSQKIRSRERVLDQVKCKEALDFQILFNLKLYNTLNPNILHFVYKFRWPKLNFD